MDYTSTGADFTGVVWARQHKAVSLAVENVSVHGAPGYAEHVMHPAVFKLELCPLGKMRYYQRHRSV